MRPLAILAALPLAALAGDSQWELANEEDDFELKVYTREKAGTDVAEVKAVCKIPAPVEKIWQAINDLDNYKDFMPYTEVSKTLEKKGDSIFWYTVINAPLVSRRDYCLELKPEKPKDPNGTWKSSWKVCGNRADIPKSEHVRITRNNGYWLLTPADGGKATQVEYLVDTDPGGSIPAWIRNKANTKAIPDLMEAVAKRAGVQL